MVRRRSESAISFFSFQDVIMSVVGIVILITMILILKLIAQTTLAAASASSVDVSELQRQVEAMRPILREIQDEVVVLHRLKNEANVWVPSQDEIDAVKMSLEQLEADAVAMKTKTENARQRNEELKHDPKIQQLAETAARVEKLQEEVETLEQENEKRKKEAKDLQAKVTPLREKIKDLDLDIAADVSKQLKVKVPTHQDKTAFILLYGDGVIDILPTDGSAKRSFRSRSDLDRWIGGCDKNKEYFVVYVRPSRFGEHEKIVQELKKQGFEVGLQVIGEETDFILN